MKNKRSNSWVMPGLLLAALLAAWFHFSNPRAVQFSEDGYEPEITPLPALWSNEDLHNRPVVLIGYTQASLSTSVAGAFLLADHHQGHRLMILSRGFTPKANEMVAVLCIPRKVMLVNDRVFLVAAYVEYQYIELEDLKEEPLKNILFTKN